MCEPSRGWRLGGQPGQEPWGSKEQSGDGDEARSPVGRQSGCTPGASRGGEEAQHSEHLSGEP